MILGFISAFLFIIIFLRFIENGHNEKRKIKLLSKIHLPASLILIIAVVLHIALSIPLIKSRPISILITGITGIVLIIISFISGIKKIIKIHRLTALLAFASLLLHIVFNINGAAEYQNKVRNMVLKSIDTSKASDGVYIGECDVTYISVKVAVTVKSYKITDIAILEHRNERGESAERIIENIVAQQQIDVDAISSATNSSIVIKKAVENALQYAIRPEH